MNLDVIIYVVKVNLIMMFCYALFHVFMRASVSHNWKRGFLLMAPIVALATPLISVNTEVISTIKGQLPEISLAESTVVLSENSTGIMGVFLVIWLLGVCVVSMRSFREFLRMLRSKGELTGGAAFTFLQSIYVAEDMPDSLKDQVMTHEQVHASQWHSLDVLWYELFRIIFWFNPIYKYGQFALKEIHEYIADAKTNKETENYSEALLAYAFGVSEFPLASEFKSVTIKNRIKMMNKSNSKRQRAGIFMSLALAMLAVVTVSWTSVTTDQLENQKVCKDADVMPVFNGCDASQEKEAVNKCSHERMMNYMIKSVKYPKVSMDKGIEGKVFVEFTVDEKGNVKDAVIKKSVDKLLDAESLRVVRSMPQWIPGEKDGKSVDVSLTLPINFTL